MERHLRAKLLNGSFDALPRHSRLMGRIRATGNKSTEQALRLAIVRSQMRGWEMHRHDLPGKPDFYFSQNRLAVFVDGCFWHGCDTCGHRPRKNNAYWTAKIDRNRARDIRNARALRRLNISVLRFWEHDIASGIEVCIKAIRHRLKHRSKLRRFRDQTTGRVSI